MNWLLLAASIIAPPGYWNCATGCLPCHIQRPYTASVCPTDGFTYYLRYDASILPANPWAGPDEAISAGQGGGAHTHQYTIQTTPTSGIGWTIPLASPKAGGGAYIWRAPYRDVPVRNRPGLTLCMEYADLAAQYGEDADACPSNVSPEVYAAQMMQGAEWVQAWPTVNQSCRLPKCTGPPPPTATKTPIPPTKTPVPPTPTPGPDPAWQYIEALAREGVTVGCGNNNFCPDRTITRREVAVWLAKAMCYELQKCVARFNDVPCVTP